MKSWRISGDAILQLFVPLQKNEIKKIIKKHVWVHLDVLKLKITTAETFFLFLSIHLYKWKIVTQSKLTNTLNIHFQKQFYKKELNYAPRGFRTRL